MPVSLLQVGYDIFYMPSNVKKLTANVVVLPYDCQMSSYWKYILVISMNK
jgi:hypothetical protein